MGVTLRVACRTDVGRFRGKNEDALVAVDLSRGDVWGAPRWNGHFEVGRRGALLAVSDGMGGYRAGEVASALVLSSLVQSLVGGGEAPCEPSRLTQAVDEANHAVWSESCTRNVEMGATLTALVVHDGRALVAEVGDSRAYLIRNGRIAQLTKDQSYVQMLVDRGAVPPDEAQNMPFRNVVLQAMGLHDHVRVALGELSLRRRDCLLLCSDGLSNELSDREIREVVLGCAHLADAADRLVDLANERGGRDNETVVLAGVGGDLPAASTRERIEQTFQVIQAFEV